jgi:hypothetical protein
MMQSMPIDMSLEKDLRCILISVFYAEPTGLLLKRVSGE